MEGKFDDENLSREKCFHQCLDPGSCFSSTARGQKTTSVKRRRRAEQVCR